MTSVPDPLRVLVTPHRMDVGGSQLNAIDLATAIRDRGHEVHLAGPPGPLLELVEQRGLPFHPLPRNAAHAARQAMTALNRLVNQLRPDVVHAFEWAPAMLAYYGSHLRAGMPLVVTVNSMSVPPFLPGSVPLLVSTPLIAAETGPRLGGTAVLEIPTDTYAQHPDLPTSEFRVAYGIADKELVVVVVSRLARELKLKGLLCALRAAGTLAHRHRMRLVIVGDGPAAHDVQTAAADVNARVGRPVVVLTGELLDPRPAYAAADIVVGMGGSLLRGMAFGKACVVQGEEGFFEVLSPETVRAFRWRGFYGIGDGRKGEDRLAALLDRLLGDPEERRQLATFSLELVRSHYSLPRAAEQQELVYRNAIAAGRRRPSPTEAVCSAAGMTGYLAGRQLRLLAGCAPDDDFNSLKHIAAGVRAPVPAAFEPEPASANGGPALRLALVTHVPPGNDGGIERVVDQQVRALRQRGHDVTVVSGCREGNRWTDRALSAGRLALRRPARLRGLDVLLAHYPPAPWLSARTGVPYVHYFHHPLRAVHPTQTQLRQRRVQLWRLIGRAFFDALDRRGVRDAAEVAVPSPAVAEALERLYGRTGTVLPCGVDHEFFRPDGRPRSRHLLFVGRIGEPYKHLDWAIEVAERLGVPLHVIGQTTALSASPNVVLLGPCYGNDLVREYRSAAVLLFPSEHEDFGLVPLEAMACGLPVVAWDDGFGPSMTCAPGSGGVLARPYDRDALAAVTRRLLEDDDLSRALSMAGPEWVRSRFSLNLHVDRLEALLWSAVGLSVAADRRTTRPVVPEVAVAPW